MDELAAAALARFGLSPEATAELCNVSENHTYRVDDPESGRRYALRVHRPGYRTARQIESELEWLDALRGDGAVDTCVPVRAPGGEHVVAVSANGLERNVVLFDWLPGSEPDPEGDEVIAGFRLLGAVSAHMHAHARAWTTPDGFDRPAWDYDHTLGLQGHWGAWQDGLGIGPEERGLLARLDAAIAGRLAAYGRAPERFGLVHADIRLANLLVDGGHVRVIDFDDCGYAWFMYDFATTVSFMEDHPRVPELRDAWLEGYRSVAPLPAADEAELDTFVMLRRLLLVAWIGSHHTFATEAAELGAGFTAGTCALAERYLSTHT
ncbi:MAG TPA: phosphotransferase [Solirubrobacteraceae bacterium]|nr:phosphotransferase [Solirubrobacteraceae bacterium]